MTSDTVVPTSPSSGTVVAKDADNDFTIEELVGPTGATAASAGTVGTGSSAGCPSTAATIGSAGSFG